MRLLLALALTVACSAAELKTASAQPIKYYLSLPQGWSAAKRWPVVMVIESAERNYENAAAVFEKARGNMPFILVTPLVVTNGGPGYRTVMSDRYSEAVWALADRMSSCHFDERGLAAVAADIVKTYSGEDRYYVTGFEAGGHTVWSLLFRHPEALRGVANVATNYLGRCMEDGAFHAAVPDLPIRVFWGADDPASKSGSPLVTQTARAVDVAKSRGYRNFSEAVIPGRAHVPLADEVLAWFDSLHRAR